MWNRLLWTLALVGGWFKRDPNEIALVTERDAPLDQVERLQRDDAPLSVWIEFGRGGW